MTDADLKAFIDASGACADPARVCALAACFGLAPAAAQDIEAGRALAARLISDDLTSADLLGAVQAITGASLFVYREADAITGVLGFFSLRQKGLEALMAGGFDARAFDFDIVARPGERPYGGYAFGVAASTKAGGQAIIRASAAIQEAQFWAVPIFTRIATEDGARVLLGDLGFERLPHDATLAHRAPRKYPLEGFRAGKAA